MAAWVREEEKASEHRQRKREAEEADKVKVTPGVTVASLSGFRAVLIGLTQGLPARRRLRRYGSLKTLRVRCLEKNLNAPRPSEHFCINRC